MGKSLPVSAENEERTDGNTLTLAVEPQQALILTLAAERGDIRLMLRSPGDQEKPAVPPVDLPRLLVVPQ